MLNQLILVAKLLSSKYTRSKDQGTHAFYIGGGCPDK